MVLLAASINVDLRCSPIRLEALQRPRPRWITMSTGATVVQVHGQGRLQSIMLIRQTARARNSAERKLRSRRSPKRWRLSRAVKGVTARGVSMLSW